MSQRILILTQLPPPVHGASVMNKIVVETVAEQENLSSRALNISPLEKIADIGKFRFYKMFHFFLFIPSLLKQLMYFRPDLIYFTMAPHGFAFYRDLVVIALLHLSGARRVLHLHGKGIAKRASQSWWQKLLYRAAFHKATVVVLSKQLRNDVSGVVPAENIKTLSNGVPDSFFGLTKEMKQDSAPIRFLFLSNMKKTKGPLVLLRALSLLKKEGYSFEADFVGGWVASMPESYFSEQAAILNVSDNITCWGPKYGEEKLAFLKRADALVFPTYYENEAFPLVILEGMSAGLPIISTNEGGIPDIFTSGHEGFLTTPQDEQALFKSLEILTNDAAKRQRMGQSARRTYEEKFTLGVFRKNLLELFQSEIKA